MDCMARAGWLLVLSGLALGACGGDDDFESQPTASIAGSWSGDLRNSASTCPGTYRIGELNAVTLKVTQSDTHVSVDVQGLAGLALAAAYGSSVFNGTVDGATFEATLLATRAVNEGNCDILWLADIQASVEGKSLVGSVLYSPDASTIAACPEFAGCTRKQTFALARD